MEKMKGQLYCWLQAACKMKAGGRRRDARVRVWGITMTG